MTKCMYNIADIFFQSNICLYTLIQNISLYEIEKKLEAIIGVST